MSTQSDAAKQFLKTVATGLGWSPQIHKEGATHILSGRSDHRDISVCLGSGSGFWLQALLPWATFPADAAIECAPTGGYARAKFTELDAVPAATGNARFDDVFLALTPDRTPMPDGVLTPAVQSVLWRYQQLRPAISSAAIVQYSDTGMALVHPPAGHVRLTCRPDMRDDAMGAGFVKMGTQRFTPAHCLAAVRQMVALGLELEPQRR